MLATWQYTSQGLQQATHEGNPIGGGGAKQLEAIDVGGYQFLRQYRATPHTSTKFSPHRLLFGREPGTKLPCVSTVDNHDNRSVHAAARENDKQAKQYQKTYADKRNKAEHNNLHVGDMVLMRNDKPSNKLSSPFSHKPMFATDIRGTALTAVDDNHSIRRNTSRFRKILDPLPCVNEMGGGDIDVPTGAIVSSIPTAVVHTPDKSFCDAERDAVVPRLSSLQPLARCPCNNDHSDAAVFPAVWMTTRSTRTVQNA